MPNPSADAKTPLLPSDHMSNSAVDEAPASAAPSSQPIAAAVAPPAAKNPNPYEKSADSEPASDIKQSSPSSSQAKPKTFEEQKQELEAAFETARTAAQMLRDAGYEEAAKTLEKTTRGIADTITPENIKVKICDIFGEVITALAMVPQGVLGAALGCAGANSIDSTGILPAISLLLFGFASFEGKRRLIRFFNTAAFKSYAKLTLNDLDPRQYSGLELFLMIINLYFTHVAAKTFGNLAIQALQQITKIFQDPKFLLKSDAMADFFGDPATMLFFAVVSYLANMLAFPGIHRRGIQALASIIEYCLRDRDYLNWHKIIEDEVNAVANELNDSAKTNNWAKYNEIAEKLGFKPDPANKNIPFLNTKSPQELRLAIIKYRASLPPLPQQDPKKFWAIRILAAICNAITVTGFVNFFEITGLGNTALKDVTNGIFDFTRANTWEGICDVGSMSLMAVSAVGPSVIQLFEGRKPLQFYSNKKYKVLIALTIAIALLGGMPNGEQQVLDDQASSSNMNGWAWTLIAAAFLASAFTEMSGIWGLFHEGANNSNANTPRQQTALANDAYLFEVAKAPITAEQMRELIVAYVAEPVASAAPTANAKNEQPGSAGNDEETLLKSNGSIYMNLGVPKLKADTAPANQAPKEWREYKGKSLHPFWLASTDKSMTPAADNKAARAAARLRVQTALQGIGASANAATGGGDTPPPPTDSPPPADGVYRTRGDDSPPPVSRLTQG